MNTPTIYARVIDLIDASMQEAATEAELKQPGSGFRFILDTLDLRNLERDADAELSSDQE